MTKVEYIYRINHDLDLTIEWIDVEGQAHTGEIAQMDVTRTALYVRYVDNNPTLGAYVPIARASFVNPTIEHNAADLYKVWEGD